MKRDNSKVGKTAIQIVTGVFFLVAVIYSFSGQAQVFGLASMIAEHPVGKVKAFGKVSPFAENAAPNDKAISQNTFMNSSYEGIKPKLTLSGNRLYFSYMDRPANADGVNDPGNIWYVEFEQVSASGSESVQRASHFNSAGPNGVNPVNPAGDKNIRVNPYFKTSKMHAGHSYNMNRDGQWALPLSIDIKGHYNMRVHIHTLVSVRNGKLTLKL